MSELYIGLMSGTSLDGIDVALVDFNQSQPKLLETFYQAYTPSLRQEVLTLCQSGPDEINRLGELDVKLGKEFAEAINQLLKNKAIPPQKIRAIGSHGQTIRHHPEKHFTLQIGDPNIIAAETGITTIADFRRRDIACGGQGAPLVPAFHHSMFAKEKSNRIILNLGGIANITILPADGRIFGFDTGPANTLLDAWIEKNLQKSSDEKGMWAAQGKVNHALLNNLLNDDYFKRPPPKSTGREYFHLKWLQSYLTTTLAPVDIQATLVELTAQSILDAVRQHIVEGDILVCGGGVHNEFLMSRLTALGERFMISSTHKFGVDPDWVEAIAFAWLAKQTLAGKPGNIPAVTGAKTNSILGAIYQA